MKNAEEMENIMETLNPARQLDKIIAHLTAKGVQVAYATYSPFDKKAFVSIKNDTLLTQALGVSATRVNKDAAGNQRYRLESLQLLNPQSEDDTMLTQALGVSASRVNNDAAGNRRYRLESLQILNPQSEFAFMRDLQGEESQIELSFQG